jgi:hypothetical protein
MLQRSRRMSSMKKWLLLLVVVVVAIMLTGALAYLSRIEPQQRPPSSEKIELTPERIARGRYLAENVIGCFDCHTDRRFERWGMPPFRERLGSGASRCWDESFGVPGTVCFPNLTPDPETGLGRWSDGEIMRAIREGVDREGRALIVMPAYRQLSDEDTRAIVAHLRSMKPIRVERPKTRLGFFASVRIKGVPRPLTGPVPEIDRGDEVAYGRYLARLAGCEFCHTPTDERGQPIRPKIYSGGRRFKLTPSADVTSTNLTPHPTGLKDVTRAAFISGMRAADEASVSAVKVAVEENTVMPWVSYAGMTEEDLGAIHAFLGTIPPIENHVEKRRRPIFSRTATTAAAP